MPKPDGSTRLILDLSSPRGSSINDGIPKEPFSVKYAKFDDAVAMVALMPHAYMGKIDIRHAFRLCPVHPDDWPLLVYCWDGRYYVDIVLPFGGRSSPFIFNSLADAFMWIATTSYKVTGALHYLDDYFFAAPSIGICKSVMTGFQNMCSDLNVPLAREKTEGPTQCITFLGIEIDSINSCCRLPTRKLNDLHKLLDLWKTKVQCSKKELLSLIGSLSFAAKVVKPGRTFLRRLIDLSTTVSSLSDIILISNEAKEDIGWWQEFSPSWNGVALIQDPPVSDDSINLHTDASPFGLGAVFGNSWLMVEVPHQARMSPIHILEFEAIMFAIFTWADKLRNKQVMLHCDNLAIVQVWTHGACRDRNLMVLVRKLFLFLARNNTHLILRHLPGKLNKQADALSRFQVNQFFYLNPVANPTPSLIPIMAWSTFDNNVLHSC